MAYNPLRNLWLKVLAVLIAGGLWFIVAGEHVVERSLRVPLEFRNVPEGLEIMGDPPSSVDVRLRGSSGVLSRVQPGEIVAVLDLREARRGMRLFHLRNQQVSRPFGVDVVQVHPPTLSLDLQPTGSKVVPVSPALDGEPAIGYRVRAVTVDPVSVEIIGPEDVVREVTEAITEPVTISGARGPVHDTVVIGLARSTVRLRQPQSARVVVDIVPAQDPDPEPEP